MDCFPTNGRNADSQRRRGRGINYSNNERGEAFYKNGQKTKVIVGAGSNNTIDAVRYTERAKTCCRCGACGNSLL